MKRAAIFLHGNPPNERVVKQHIKKDNVIICADGGTEYAFNLGLKPSVVIGDFDSLSKILQDKLARENIPVQTYPREKDETDSELLVRYVVEKGFRAIVVFGWMGTRYDHVLSNLFMFGSLKKTVQVILIEERQVLYFVKNKLLLNGNKGGLVSLIPLNGDVGGVSTKGLKWVLQHETLLYGKTRGISNEFTAKNAIITVRSGTLLVIQHVI